MKYKIQGIGLDTTTLEYSPLKLKSRKESIQYIFTNPAANNDFVIADYVKYLDEKVSLVTEINYVDGVDEVLKSHVSTFGRWKYDLLFIPGNLDYEKFDLSVTSIRDSGISETLGLSRPKDLETLKKNHEYLREIGVRISSVLLDISPLHIQKDIIEYCETNRIYVFSCNSFGGRVNAGYAIEKYTVPYLLKFAAVWSDVVFLSGRDMYQGELSENYLNTLKGQLVENEHIYEVPGNVDDLIPTPQKKISTALLIENMTLPYNNPEYIFNPEEIKVSTLPILPEFKKLEEKTQTESDIDALIQVIYKPEDLGDDDYFVSLRYKIEEFLAISHEGWEKELLKITDKIIYLKYIKKEEKKKWYGKIYTEVVDKNTYLLYYSDGLLEFRELKEKVGEKRSISYN